MPRKPKSRKPNNRKKNKQRGRKVASKKRKTHKKRERSKVKGGYGYTNVEKQEQKPLNLTDGNYSGDEEDLNTTGYTFKMPKTNDRYAEVEDDAEVETQMKFNPPKIPPSKAGMGIGAVALVGGVAALLILAK